jgi:hypothetical protein
VSSDIVTSTFIGGDGGSALAARAACAVRGELVRRHLTPPPVDNRGAPVVRTHSEPRTVASHGQQGAERAGHRGRRPLRGIELYAASPALPFADLAGEVGSEVRLLRVVQTELAGHLHEAGEDAAHRFTVVTMDGNRIDRVRIEPLGEPPSRPETTSDRA